MSIVIARGISLEVKLELVLLLNLHSYHLQMTNVAIIQKEGPYTY